jgi:2-polyprenyl-3-methyl-5-hydroxy-6-metoxy-1,4-benzoquinol methylase
MEVEKVPCILCKGSGTTESLPRYTLSDTFHEIPGTFVLRRCLRCGLMYLSPRPTPATISAYYPTEYTSYRRPIEDERLALMRWIRRRKLTTRRHLVERYSGQRKGRLLDVGCSTGLFLHEMAEDGWQVAGVEPIAFAAEFAQRRFALNVFQGTLHDAPYEPASFDVVTFWDVLEHTFSPVDELAKASSLLRPGGLVALSIPNWNSWDRWLFGRHWQGLDPPRHLYVFTQETLTAMLTQTGLSVMAWVCFMPGYFSSVMSLERWLKTISPRFSRFVKQVLSLPGMRFPFEPWFSIANWMKKGPIISVFARKTSGMHHNGQAT